MDVMPIDLTPITPFEAARHLQSVNCWELEAGLDDLAGLLSQGPCFRVDGPAGMLGAYGLRIEHWPGGVVGWVIAGAGRVPGQIAARDFLPVVERQLAGCDLVAVQTRRLGLIRRLEAAGYHVAGHTLVKRLGAH